MSNYLEKISPKIFLVQLLMNHRFEYLTTSSNLFASGLLISALFGNSCSTKHRTEYLNRF